MYAYCIQQLREKKIYGRTRAYWIFFVCCVVVVGFFFGGGMGGVTITFNIHILHIHVQDAN